MRGQEEIGNLNNKRSIQSQAANNVSSKRRKFDMLDHFESANQGQV